MQYPVAAAAAVCKMLSSRDAAAAAAAPSCPRSTTRGRQRTYRRRRARLGCCGRCERVGRLYCIVLATLKVNTKSLGGLSKLSGFDQTVP